MLHNPIRTVGPTKITRTAGKFRRLVKAGYHAVVGVTLCFAVSAPLMAQQSGYQEAFAAYQNQQYSEAESGWTALASEGNRDAQYALGVMHLNQQANNSSPETAISWLDKAAEQGHPAAMYNLGVAYWEGAGVARDRAMALSLWNKAADKGDSGAQFNLGLAHYIGAEVEPDLKLAHSWFRMAADQGHEEADHMLEVIKAEIQTPPPEIETASASASESVSSEPEPDKQEPEATPTAPLRPYWKISSQSSQIYDEPGGTGFDQLPPGTPVEVAEQNGDWSRITLPDGLRTWIYSRYIDIDGETGIVDGDKVRIRPSPTTNNAKSPPLGFYLRNDRLRVLGRQSDWVEVRAPKNITVWVMTKDMVEYQDTAENRAAAWTQARDSGA